jgi:hypothetical protein
LFAFSYFLKAGGLSEKNSPLSLEASRNKNLLWALTLRNSSCAPRSITSYKAGSIHWLRENGYEKDYSALSLEIYHEEDEEVNRSENKRKFDMYVPVK